MKGCLQDVAIMAATCIGFNLIDAAYGLGVAIAVATTALVGLVAFLWHVGGRAA